MPRIEAFEATFKAALKLSLDQWARRQAGTLAIGAAVHARPPRRPPQGRHRAAARVSFRRRGSNGWRRRLSLVFGVEVLIVLKDIWGLDGGRDAVGGAMGGDARWSRRPSRKGKERSERGMLDRLTLTWNNLVRPVFLEARKNSPQMSARILRCVRPWMKPN